MKRGFGENVVGVGGRAEVVVDPIATSGVGGEVGRSDSVWLVPVAFGKTYYMLALVYVDGFGWTWDGVCWPYDVRIIRQC